MLKTSWTLILAESTNDPTIVPQGSYSERIADRIWGSGAWLVWRAPSSESDTAGAPAGGIDASRDTTPASSPAEFEAAVTALRQYVSRRLLAGGVSALVKDVAADARLSETERAVLLYFAATADHSQRLISAIRAESGLVNRAIDFLKDKLAATGLVQRAREIVESELGLRTQLSSERLVRSLGLPAGSLKRAVVSLAEKVARGNS